MKQPIVQESIEAVKSEEEEAAAEVDSFRHRVDDVVVKVDELEQKVNDVAQFYSSLNKKQLNSSRGSSAAKDKDKDKDKERQQIFSVKRLQQEAAKKEAASAKRMQDLIRQFGTIFRQITAHKWAWPFMHPVDVEGLGLDDYYEVIDKPMDFTTIKNQMEAKDGTGYKNVREIFSDVKLVFKNAMTYNDDRSDVHVMAKTLLAKFEEKWLLLLPEVIEEENRRKEEETELRLGMQLAQEAANAKTARHLSNDLSELEGHLDVLREQVLQKCRKMSVDEKKQLGAAFNRMSPDDIAKALEIFAHNDPNFQAGAEEITIDMGTQSESTLWRLKFFVKGALEAKVKGNAEAKVGNDNNKRKQDICDALAIAKTAKKRKK